MIDIETVQHQSIDITAPGMETENPDNERSCSAEEENSTLGITTLMQAQCHVQEPIYSIGPLQQGAELFGKILEKDTERREGLVELYEEIETFMDDESLDEHLHDEMLIEFGNSNRVLEIKEYIAELKDLEECPIVVAGETGAGKSSFVNLLLGYDILPHSLLTCTATICRLRNSQEKKVSGVEKDNQMTLLDLPKDMDAKTMKSKLKEIVSKEPNKYIYVDIYWPIPLLQGRAVIVDTPGIGSSEELTQRLFQYLPKAVAFIYVINTLNSGGIQSDRLLELEINGQGQTNVPIGSRPHLIWDYNPVKFRSIERLPKLPDIRKKIERLFEVQKEGGTTNDFEPSRAIFVCNKWDQVPEDEEDIVWNDTIKKLKRHWPNFDESQIFKLSTTEEWRRSKTPGSEHTPTFHKLLTGISKMVPASLAAKLYKHLRWQKRFLDQLMKRIDSRIKLSSKEKDQKKTLKESVEERTKELKNDLQTVKREAKAKAKEYCVDISHHLYEHLRNSKTRDRMFSWSISDLPKESNIEVVEKQVKELIRKKIKDEIGDWCSTNNINNISKVLTDLFKEECKRIDTNYSEINRLLLDIRKPLSEGLHDCSAQCAVFHDPLFTNPEKVVLAVTSPLWLPLVVGAGLIALPFGVIAGVKDLLKPTMKLNDYILNRLSYMMKIGDSILEEYAPNTIYSLLEKTYLKDFNKIVDNICDIVIPNQIAADEKFIENIKNDMRSPSEISRHYQPLETKCKSMIDKLLRIQMDYFVETN